MNPVDHPMGGGEVAPRGGRHPCSPWGSRPRARRPATNKRTDQRIIRRRNRVADALRSVEEGSFVDHYLHEEGRVRPGRSRGPIDKRVVSTWSRRSTITAELVGLTMAVHNGRKFMPVFVTEQHGRPQARRVRAHAHVPRPQRRAQEAAGLSHASTLTRPRHLACRPARCGWSRAWSAASPSRRPWACSTPHAEEGRAHRSPRLIKSAAGQRRATSPAATRRSRICGSCAVDRRHRSNRALHAALDGPRQPHQSARPATLTVVVTDDETRAAKERRSVGQKTHPTGFRLGIIKTWSLEVVRGEELRQVAA